MAIEEPTPTGTELLFRSLKTGDEIAVQFDADDARLRKVVDLLYTELSMGNADAPPRQRVIAVLTWMQRQVQEKAQELLRRQRKRAARAAAQAEADEYKLNMRNMEGPNNGNQNPA